MLEAERECVVSNRAVLLPCSCVLACIDVLQVAVVIVGYPATPVLLARARICISASHTREDLIKGLKVEAQFVTTTVKFTDAVDVCPL